jgi:hypothetical protein
MRETEDQPEKRRSPCPTASGSCPRCHATIDDPSRGEVGHWDGIPGGPLYRLACLGCGTTLLAFASGEEAVADIEWVAIPGRSRYG